MQNGRTKDKNAISVSPSFHVEADGTKNGVSVIINGVMEIIDFSATKVVLRLKRGFMILSGNAISLSLFENGGVEITGRITLWEFTHGKA